MLGAGSKIHAGSYKLIYYTKIVILIHSECQIENLNLKGQQ